MFIKLLTTHFLHFYQTDEHFLNSPSSNLQRQIRAVLLSEDKDGDQRFIGFWQTELCLKSVEETQHGGD